MKYIFISTLLFSQMAYSATTESLSQFFTNSAHHLCLDTKLVQSNCEQTVRARLVEIFLNASGLKALASQKKAHTQIE